MIKHVVLDCLYPKVFLTRSNSRSFSDLINYDNTTPIPKSDYGMIAHIVSWGSIGDKACGVGSFVPGSVPY